MGGFGSGRGKSDKGTTSDMLPLDIRQLQRDGLLALGRVSKLNWILNGNEVASIQMLTAADRVILNYRSCSNSGEWRPTKCIVSLEWSPCHFGGQRSWFVCPRPECGRRVAILFGGSIFACRHCHKLAYKCQRERVDERAMRRADTIRQRLGWGAGIANPEGGRPKGMHWRTFDRLKAEYDAFANVSLEGLADRLGLINPRRDKTEP